MVNHVLDYDPCIVVRFIKFEVIILAFVRSIKFKAMILALLRDKPSLRLLSGVCKLKALIVSTNFVSAALLCREKALRLVAFKKKMKIR